MSIKIDDYRKFMSQVKQQRHKWLEQKSPHPARHAHINDGHTSGRSARKLGQLWLIEFGKLPLKQTHAPHNSQTLLHQRAL
jgi:hypothetical protein